MLRIKVNLTLDAEVVETVHALGLNMSRLAEAAIAAYAQEVTQDGLPLASFRTF